MVVLLFIAMILTCLIVDYFVQRKQDASLLLDTAPNREASMAPVLQAQLAGVDQLLPSDYVYAAPGHLWSVLLPDGVFRMGADNLVTNAIGDVDEIVLPEEGLKVRAGEPIATLKRDGHSIHLRAPFSGTIEKINGNVKDKPSAIKSGAIDDSWIMALKPQRLTLALKQMRFGTEAKKWMQKEMTRLRDFLAAQASEPTFAGAMLQDGGAPAQGVLTYFKDETWKQFENDFLKP